MNVLEKRLQRLEHDNTGEQEHTPALVLITPMDNKLPINVIKLQTGKRFVRLAGESEDDLIARAEQSIRNSGVGCELGFTEEEAFNAALE